MIPETSPSRLSSTAKRMSFQVFLAVAVAILFPFPGLGQANSSGMFPLLFADFCGGVSDHPPILSGIFAAFFVFLALAMLIMGVGWAFWKKEGRIAPLFDGLACLSYLAATISATFHPTLALEAGLFLGFMGFLPNACAFISDLIPFRAGRNSKNLFLAKMVLDTFIYVACLVALLLLVAVLMVSLFFVVAGFSGHPFALVAGGLGL